MRDMGIALMESKLQSNRLEKHLILLLIGWMYLLAIMIFFLNSNLAWNIGISSILVSGTAALAAIFLRQDWRLWLASAIIPTISIACLPFTEVNSADSIAIGSLLFAMIIVGLYQAYIIWKRAIDSAKIMNDLALIKDRQVVIRVHHKDAVRPNFAKIQATIKKAFFWTEDNPALIVKPNIYCAKSKDFAIDIILVLGVSLNIVHEIFGTSRHAVGSPTLIKMYRIKDETTMKQLLTSKRLSPNEEYLGLGAISAT